MEIIRFIIIRIDVWENVHCGIHTHTHTARCAERMETMGRQPRESHKTKQLACGLRLSTQLEDAEFVHAIVFEFPI